MPDLDTEKRRFTWSGPKTHASVIKGSMCPAATSGRHGDGVQVSGVTDVVGLKLAVGQVPDLTKIVSDA